MPSPSGRALVVIDAFNHYEFDGGEELAASAARALAGMRRLIAEATARAIPVVYVNDRHGDWSAGPGAIIARARRGRHPELLDALLPPPSAAFLAKSRHSAFYGTSLEELLAERGASRIVLCGQATEQCVLYSALDAYIRGIKLTVARDAVAHIDPALADAALSLMQRNMGAAVVPACDALAVDA